MPRRIVLGVKMQLKAIFLTEMVTMLTDDSSRSGQPYIYLVNKRWNQMNLISLLTKISVNNGIWMSK